MLAHRLALAGRALLTYALNAFIEVLIIDGTSNEPDGRAGSS
jgi:hypothetical protein